ncbi:MAG: hypothetical protein LBH13_05850 [Cellulomonadaceae bacterium]|nr:hypothetical protein [Cellulomonadaceae bacterium]
MNNRITRAIAAIGTAALLVSGCAIISQESEELPHTDGLAATDSVEIDTAPGLEAAVIAEEPTEANPIGEPLPDEDMLTEEPLEAEIAPDPDATFNQSLADFVFDAQADIPAERSAAENALGAAIREVRIRAVHPDTLNITYVYAEDPGIEDVESHYGSLANTLQGTADAWISAMQAAGVTVDGDAGMWVLLTFIDPADNVIYERYLMASDAAGD